MYSYPLHTSICQSLIDVLLYTHSPKEAEEKRATDYSSVAKIQLQMTIAPFSFVSQEIWGQQLLWTTQYTNISITASFRYQALNQKCQKCQVINSGIQSGLKANYNAKLESKYYKKDQIILDLKQTVLELNKSILDLNQNIQTYLRPFWTYIRPIWIYIRHKLALYQTIFRPKSEHFRPKLEHLDLFKTITPNPT